MIKRIFSGIMLAALVVFLPAWAAMALGIAFAFIFPWYLELFCAAIILDMISGAPVPALYGFEHFYLACAAAAFLAAWLARRRFRIYQQHE